MLRLLRTPGQELLRVRRELLSLRRRLNEQGAALLARAVTSACAVRSDGAVAAGQGDSRGLANEGQGRRAVQSAAIGWDREPRDAG